MWHNSSYKHVSTYPRIQFRFNWGITYTKEGKKYYITEDLFRSSVQKARSDASAPRSSNNDFFQNKVWVYSYERKSSYDTNRICRMKDQWGIPHTEQTRIHSIFRGSTESSASQISITLSMLLNIFRKRIIQYNIFNYLI